MCQSAACSIRLLLASLPPLDGPRKMLKTFTGSIKPCSPVSLTTIRLQLQATLHPFTESWKTVGYYIKFDDDITYIRRGTNEAVLHEKLQEPY
ncbi:hypothetical protein WJX79_003799 [Trebouxia sp. C0005]